VFISSFGVRTGILLCLALDLWAGPIWVWPIWWQWSYWPLLWAISLSYSNFQQTPQHRAASVILWTSDVAYKVLSLLSGHTLKEFVLIFLELGSHHKDTITLGACYFPRTCSWVHRRDCQSLVVTFDLSGAC
jgi:hypothetical protein